MSFEDYFKPMVGDTKEQIVGRLEAMLQELDKMAKKGYEHDAKKCSEPTIVSGEKVGGWVDAKMGTCSACGLYVGKVSTQVAGIRGLLNKFKELPESYKYGGVE